MTVFEIENPAEWFVWFDLDDTLWDFSFNSRDTLCEVYSHYGLSRFWKDSSEWCKVYHSVNDPLWEEYAKGTITSELLRFKRFHDTFILGGMDEKLAKSIAAEVDRFYLDRLATRSRSIDGARELIIRLTRRGFHLGILSNGFEKTQIKKLQSAGMDSYFDYIISSDTAGHNKPDPEIYRYAETIAKVRADRCIMIGDNPSTDIEGALNAGWKYSVLYNKKGAKLPFVVVQAIENGRCYETSNLNEIDL